MRVWLRICFTFVLDDEYVTIAEEFDLSYAIHTYRVLRLKLIGKLS